eukprot:3592267-Rhodomonas_salina.1
MLGQDCDLYCHGDRSATRRVTESDILIAYPPNLNRDIFFSAGPFPFPAFRAQYYDLVPLGQSQYKSRGPEFSTRYQVSAAASSGLYHCTALGGMRRQRTAWYRLSCPLRRVGSYATATMP